MLGKKRGRKKGSKNKSKLLNTSSLINVDENKKIKIKELIIAGKDRGFLTYAEINDHLPDDITDTDQIDIIIKMINEMGIKVFDEAPHSDILLNDDNWIQKYIFWELDLFKAIGYDLNLIELVDKKLINNKTQYISKSSLDKKIIPNFLVDKTQSSEDLKTLLSGLKLVSDYLDKSILKPNNLNQPISRLQFINTLRELF